LLFVKQNLKRKKEKRVKIFVSFSLLKQKNIKKKGKKGKKNDERDTVRGHLRREGHRPRREEVRQGVEACVFRRELRDGPGPGRERGHIPSGGQPEVDSCVGLNPQLGWDSVFLEFEFLEFDIRISNNNNINNRRGFLLRPVRQAFPPRPLRVRHVRQGLQVHLREGPLPQSMRLRLFWWPSDDVEG